jgi:hypothetical protein
MPLLDVFWATLWFFLFVAWVWLVVSVFGDIFRSEDLGGWGKALWTIAVLVFPVVGVFVYLIVRGRDMHARSARMAVEAERARQQYIREIAAAPSAADELAKLAQLRDQGVIDLTEYESQKAKLLT